MNVGFSKNRLNFPFFQRCHVCFGEEIHAIKESTYNLHGFSNVKSGCSSQICFDRDPCRDFDSFMGHIVGKWLIWELSKEVYQDLTVKE